MISVAEAVEVAGALRAAAQSIPLRQIRCELEGRALEYDRAAELCSETEDEGVIEMCSSVTRGMRVYHDRFGWSLVIRKLNDGMSLHCEAGDNPNGWYKNFLDPTSPAVVKA